MHELICSAKLASIPPMCSHLEGCLHASVSIILRYQETSTGGWESGKGWHTDGVYVLKLNAYASFLLSFVNKLNPLHLQVDKRNGKPGF